MPTVPIYPDNGPNHPVSGTIQKPVLVLGASGEVGQAVVGALLQAQLAVIAVAPTREELASLVRPEGTHAELIRIPGNAHTETAGAALANAVRLLRRPPGAVIAMIGGEFTPGRLLDQPVDRLREKLDEDLFPHLVAARHLVPMLAENEARGATIELTIAALASGGTLILAENALDLHGHPHHGSITLLSMVPSAITTPPVPSADAGTGAWQTAELFRSWRADLPLLAEPGGGEITMERLADEVPALLARQQPARWAALGVSLYRGRLQFNAPGGGQPAPAVPLPLACPAEVVTLSMPPDGTLRLPAWRGALRAEPVSAQGVPWSALQGMRVGARAGGEHQARQKRDQQSGAPHDHSAVQPPSML